MATTSFYMLLSAVLFSIGTLGFLIRRNAIVLFMCVELMLNGVNISLVALAREFQMQEAQVYVFFVMAVAAAEAAVGLAIIISAFRNYMSVETTNISLLKG